MTDEQKQEAEPTIEMFVDWYEAYPVYYMSESDDTDGRVALRFTAAEIEFIDKAEDDYTAAQNLIEKRLGYRP